MALRAESPQPLDERDVMNALWDTVYQLYGEFGASQTALHQVSWDSETTTLVIRCSHKMLEPVWAAAAAITTVEETRVAIRVVAVSGTLKALQKKLDQRRK